jgi:AsmA protein
MGFKWQMGKLIKWVLKAGAFLVLAIVLLLLSIGVLFDPNDYKHHVTDFVQQKTGHQLEINGPVELQWFPSAELQLSEVRLSTNDHSFDQPLFNAAKLQLKLDWRALLGHHIKIDALTLNQPAVNLLRDQKGQGNWESLLGNLSTQESPSNDGKASDSGFTLTIHRIQMDDASVHWQDQQSGKAFNLKHLNLSTGYLQPGKPALIRTELSLAVVQPAITLDMSLSGELDVDDSFDLIDLSGMAMELTAHGENFPDAGMQLELAADMSVNFPDESFQLNDLSIAGADTHITGQLHGKGFSGLPQLDGRLVLQKTNLRSLLALLGHSVDTTDPQVLTRVSADIGMQQQGELLLLRPIQIQLDDSMIQGKAQLRAGDGLQLNGKLTVDRIDLDRYLTTAGDREDALFQLSVKVEGLRNMQLDAELAIDELTLNKIVFHDVLMKVQSSEDAISLSAN